MAKTRTLDKGALPRWVYVNLSRYGNCSIDPWRLKTLGEERIKQELRKHGFECNIRVKEIPYEANYHVRHEKYVILEVRGLVA